MEIRFYEHEWHGIPVEGIQAQEELGQLPKASFYEAFYNLVSPGDRPNSQWLTSKLNLAKWIDTAYLQPLAGDSPSSLTVLSLGAGLGVMEEGWVNSGYRVSVQECQSTSLKEFLNRHTQVEVFLGDAREVNAPSGSFDVVVISAIDYLFDRQGYLDLLREVNRLMKPSGTAIMVTASNLTMRGIARAFVERLMRLGPGTNRGKKSVFWGWMRTLAGHLSLGARSGLRWERIILFDELYRPTAERNPGFPGIIPAQTLNVAVVWKQV